MVNSGICGFAVTITVEKGKDKKLSISLDTECEMVNKMREDISLLDVRSALARHQNNPVLLSAAKHLQHVACPVASAILKAIEVEAGAALPRDVSIVFVKD